MIQVLHDCDSASWAYCNFFWGENLMKFEDFDYSKLKKNNLCSTMSLIRSDHFIGFDKEIKRLQDWDLWLRMSNKGMSGKWIDENLFFSYEEEGISKGKSTYRQAFFELKKKHQDLIL